MGPDGGARRADVRWPILARCPMSLARSGVGVTEVAADELTIRHGTVRFSVPNQLVTERVWVGRVVEPRLGRPAPSRATGAQPSDRDQPSGRDRECPGWNRD